MRSRFAKVFTVLCLCAVVGAGASQLMAGKPGGGGGGTGCPSGRFCVCAAIYCPVVCNGGCRYSNPCIADCAGATGCVAEIPCGIEVEP